MKIVVGRQQRSRAQTGDSRPREALRREPWVKRWRSAVGFTLVEILVALAVLGIIMGAVYATHRAVTGSILGIQPRMALDQNGRFFVQRLSRQLRCCYGGQPGWPSRPSGSRNDIEEGTEEESAPLFRGGQTLTDDVLLAFVTSATGLSRASDSGHLKLVSYKLDAWQHALLTREDEYRQPREDSDEGWHVILEDVVEIELEYYDGTDWQNEWDSDLSGGPPRAVRVKLVLESEVGQSFSFTSVAPAARGPRKKPESQAQRAAVADR